MIFSSKQYMGEKRSYRDGGLPIFSRATSIKGDYKPSLVGSVTNKNVDITTDIGGNEWKTT